MANEFIARKGIKVLTGGASVTGNLQVSTIISASQISGAFFGSGAGITGVISASYANSASAATSITFIPATASFATTASAATSITFIPATASFATTASAATSITFVPATASYAVTAGTTGGGVTGQGASGLLTKWTGLNTVTASAITESATNINVQLPLTASAFQGNGVGITGVISASYAGTDWGAINNKPVGLVSSSLQFGTGSYTGSFTGAFTGLGSGVTGVISSSYAVTSSAATSITFLPASASYAVTASYASNAGTVNFSTGSYTGSFTGAFQGNGAGVTGVISASYAVTSSAATSITFLPASASYAGTDWGAINNKPTVVSSSTQVSYTGLQNIPVGIISSSTQVTASIVGTSINPSIVSASSIYVTGDITARQFITQFVSASIIYQSGSTKFGDTSDDVMSVTGTMGVSGTATFLGPVTFASGAITINSGLGPTTIGGALYSTGTVTANVGTTVVATVATGSLDMAHFAYVVKSGSSYRTGIVMSVWSASTAEFTDTSTNDIGDTSDISFTVDVVTATARLKAVVGSFSGWTVKTIIQSI